MCVCVCVLCEYVNGGGVRGGNGEEKFNGSFQIALVAFVQRVGRKEPEHVCIAMCSVTART